MKIQSSFERDEAKLYVVPTPIGNLEDMTFRALAILKEVDLIAAEDTRNTMNLLRHFEIDNHLVSYHEHNELERTKQLLDYLAEGKSIALVSDAGMPAISDPGHVLVQAVIERNYDVVVLPGANAALTALVGSGLSTERFLFYGFLPRKTREMKNELEPFKNMCSTFIFYESPHRITRTLQTIYDVFGNRNVSIARELTKRFETYIRGSLKDIIASVEQLIFKGEICLIVEGSKEAIDEDPLWWSPFSVKEHVDYYMQKESLSSKDAIKQVAHDRKMGRQDVYRKFHIE
ncbi:MAG TPA: 16S rRNA (cytidine(1402)-2'-O)-methyltransferase [Bacillota bacterium]|nr:16S rRNA (cytidine(1402)-2'-O)-methyltransferase [Bacillota bacterium]